MKKVLFHIGTFCQGGCTKAILDYAEHNETILKNKSFFAFNKLEENYNNSLLEDRVHLLKNKLDVFVYKNYDDLEKYIKNKKIDYHYNLKSGENIGFLSSYAKNCIHAVFPQSDTAVHGDRYAFISKWLSEQNKLNIPYVPHIVKDWKNCELESFRAKYKIPEEAFVFGRIGSYSEFNIDFVFKSIKNTLSSNPNIWFVFVNTPSFIQHERVLFLPPIFNESKKAAFIEACDAMIHARKRGETFGLAISEFSIKNKPVLTYANSPEKAHLDILKNQAILYKNEKDLTELLLNHSFMQLEVYNAYQQFEPAQVMDKFNNVFLN